MSDMHDSKSGSETISLHASSLSELAKAVITRVQAFGANLSQALKNNFEDESVIYDYQLELKAITDFRNTIVQFFATILQTYSHLVGQEQFKAIIAIKNRIENIKLPVSTITTTQFVTAVRRRAAVSASVSASSSSSLQSGLFSSVSSGSSGSLSAGSVSSLSSSVSGASDQKALSSKVFEELVKALNDFISLASTDLRQMNNENLAICENVLKIFKEQISQIFLVALSASEKLLLNNNKAARKKMLTLIEQMSRVFPDCLETLYKKLGGTRLQRWKKTIACALVEEGAELVDQNNINAAIAKFELAYRYDGTNLQALRHLGVAYYTRFINNKDYNDAVRSVIIFEEALNREKDNPINGFNLAMSHLACSVNAQHYDYHIDAAINCLLDVTKLDISKLPVYRFLGNAYLNRFKKYHLPNDLSSAQKAYEQAKKYYQSTNTANQIALCDMRLQEIAKLDSLHLTMIPLASLSAGERPHQLDAKISVSSMQDQSTAGIEEFTGATAFVEELKKEFPALEEKDAKSQEMLEYKQSHGPIAGRNKVEDLWLHYFAEYGTLQEILDYAEHANLPKQNLSHLFSFYNLFGQTPLDLAMQRSTYDGRQIANYSQALNDNNEYRNLDAVSKLISNVRKLVAQVNLRLHPVGAFKQPCAQRAVLFLLLLRYGKFPNFLPEHSAPLTMEYIPSTVVKTEKDVKVSSSAQGRALASVGMLREQKLLIGLPPQFSQPEIESDGKTIIDLDPDVQIANMQRYAFNATDSDNVSARILETTGKDNVYGFIYFLPNRTFHASHIIPFFTCDGNFYAVELYNHSLPVAVNTINPHYFNCLKQQQFYDRVVLFSCIGTFDPRNVAKCVLTFCEGEDPSSHSYTSEQIRAATQMFIEMRSSAVEAFKKEIADKMESVEKIIKKATAKKRQINRQLSKHGFMSEKLLKAINGLYSDAKSTLSEIMQQIDLNTYAMNSAEARYFEAIINKCNSYIAVMQRPIYQQPAPVSQSLPSLAPVPAPIPALQPVPSSSADEKKQSENNQSTQQLTMPPLEHVEEEKKTDEQKLELGDGVDYSQMPPLERVEEEHSGSKRKDYTTKEEEKPSQTTAIKKKKPSPEEVVDLTHDEDESHHGPTPT